MFQTLFVGVGDVRQAIFAWRGADAQSMARCRDALDCVELPLSICYRCPTSHIDLAREYSPTLEARPGAPVGEVVDFRNGDSSFQVEDGRTVGATVNGRDVPPEALRLVTRLTPDLFRPGDAVICRKNAPLVAVAYWLMRARVPCRVVGRDFGKGLISVVESTKAQVADDVIARLRDRLRRMCRRDEADLTLDGEPSEATKKLQDQVDVLAAVVENLADRAARAAFDAHNGAAGAAGVAGATPPRGAGAWGTTDHEDRNAPDPIVTSAELCREVDHLFGGDQAGDDVVSLSSIHRAKGGEWDRVWWLDEDDCVPRARAQEWQRVEVENLRFVALTRARQSLFFVDSGALS